jgi:NitT/TauT family transport system substrate-binding protein
MTFRFRTRILLPALTLLASSMTFAGSADAQAIEKPDLSISMGSWAISYMALPLTQAKGFFDQQGLHVKVENFNRGGTQALQAVMGGSTDMVLGFYDHTIQMQLQNKGLRCIVLLGRLAGVSFAVRSDLADQIKTEADFKGKRIGVPALGSSGETLLRYAMGRAGVGQKDFTLLPVGNQGTAIAAVDHKEIDVIVSSDPAQSVLEKDGKIKLLIDGRTSAGSKQELGGNYPAACIYATEPFIEKNPVTVQHVVNAFVQTLGWMSSSSPADLVAALPPEYILGDRQAFIDIVGHYGDVFSPDGRFNLPDLELVRTVLASIDTTGRTAKVDLSKTYTNAYVDAAPRYRK